MGKIFNIAGPCNPARHYMLPAMARLPEVMRLIEDEAYFVVHAQRQCGKTTALRTLAKEINAKGERVAMYCSVEVVNAFPKAEVGIPMICDLVRAAAERLPEVAANEQLLTVMRALPREGLVSNGEESPITVALYDDRLEVTSPGKLPNGITVAKMLDGCSECRNKALAQALAYMNIIEDWGSGIPRICGDLKDAGFNGLEIIPWPNAVRIVIRRRKKDDSWSQSRREGAKEGAKEGIVSCRILSVVEGTSMSARQIAEVLGVRPTTRSFRLSLAALLDDGSLESTCGKGKRDKRQKYRLTEKGQKIVHSLQDENKV